VRDLRSGNPISAAIVRVYTVDRLKLVDTELTDAAGRYAFFVGPNQYLIQVEKNGYYPTECKCTIGVGKMDAVIAETLSMDPVRNPSFAP
jgi:hypothetical protein